MAGLLLSGHYYAVCIWPFIFVRPDIPEYDVEVTMNHERIHARQQVELLWLFFFIGYGLEYLFRLIKYRGHHKAYRSIVFEREAFDNDRNPGYLKTRKAYAWVKYWRQVQ
jgi:hypothetical protein